MKVMNLFLKLFRKMWLPVIFIVPVQLGPPLLIHPAKYKIHIGHIVAPDIDLAALKAKILFLCPNFLQVEVVWLSLKKVMNQEAFFCEAFKKI